MSNASGPVGGDAGRKMRQYAEIFALRHQQPPVIWREVAKRVGLSERHAKTLYQQGNQQAWLNGMETARQIIDDAIYGMETIKALAMDTYREAVPGSSAASRALAEYRAAIKDQMALMQDAGRLPRALTAPDIFLALQKAVAVIDRALSDPRVPVDVVANVVEEIAQLTPSGLISSGPGLDGA